MVWYNITAYNEIINFTVSKREVYNSKLRAGIKAERGMVMKGKNLERAVILGLLLSTGVYGSALAEDYNADNIQQNGIVVGTGETKDYTLNGNVKHNDMDKTWITNNGGKLTITGGEESSLDITTSGDKIISNGSINMSANAGGSNTIDVNGNINLSVNSSEINVYGIENCYGDVKLYSNKDIIIAASTSTDATSSVYALYNSNWLYPQFGINIIKDNKTEIIADGMVKISAGGSDNTGNAIHSELVSSNLVSSNNETANEITTKIQGEHVEIILNGREGLGIKGAVYAHTSLTDTITDVTNKVEIIGTGTNNNSISSNASGLYVVGGASDVSVVSQKAGNEITAGNYGIFSEAGKVYIEGGTFNRVENRKNSAISSTNGNIELIADRNKIIANKGVAISGSIVNNGFSQTQDKFEKIIKLTAQNGNNEITVNDIDTTAEYSALTARNGYKVDLMANGNNIITAQKKGASNTDGETIKSVNGIVDLTAKYNEKVENSGNNIVYAAYIESNGTGSHDALWAEGEKNDNKGTITLKADKENKIYGSVVGIDYAEVNIEGKQNVIASNNIFGLNIAGNEPLDKRYYYAVLADGTQELTADDRTEINITATDGGVNEIFSNGGAYNYTERAVFATEGGVVNINGSSIITADSWTENNADDYQANNTASALIAGTYDWENAEKDKNDKIIFDVADDERSVINLNYGNGSAVTGDIAAGYAGAVNIIGQSSDGITTFANDGEETVSASNSLQLNGNVLAANGGKVKLELGKGSVWHGRADDYQDAAEKSKWGEEHLGEFEPVFSNGIQDAGTVDVTLKDGATWDVMGQSWLTTLDGTGGVIDMRNTNGDASRTSHAVHIGELNGSHTFVMDLDTNHTDSDMLYIKDMGTNSGTQTLWINSINGLENLDENDTLRFATVKSGDIQFEGQYKFGDYGEAKNGIMLMDNGVLDTAYKIYREEYDSAKVEENTGYNGGDTFDEVKPGNSYVEDNYAEYNWYLAKDTSYDQTSDAGKTIINMSRANYKNAIYMDRLNKRMGEMRYVNGEEEQGLWVRLRHDRIGQSGDFRSMNTMYEVGYDVKQPTDNGEHRIGMAIDYMRGSTTYDDIMGKGETKRYGLWLYDTWLGEKGHYVDYVAKWGHLSNDFDITAKTTGEKINGDYSNNVFSVSAEYGKKNDMGNNWYFEPQAQLQLARVTGADYVTTQGSKVNVDGINSLIGRAGFRIGRDMDENSSVYLKADLLHEFMGDQTVTAADATGTLREEFENKGTWYDVGFGFAAKMSKNSYAFMDFEKSFGNDNDETYQINAGMQWTF